MTQLRPSPYGKNRNRPSALSGLLLGFLLLLFLASFGYATFLFFQTTRSVVANAPQLARMRAAQAEAAAQQASAQPTDAGAVVAADATGADSLTAPILSPLWSVQGRTNILLLGIDQRPNERGYYRTDTMIVLTVEPSTGDVGMLSLPRDLWVNIPGSGLSRINTAHVIGDLEKREGGGPGLAMQTVSELLGQPMHYYARINFEGFRKIIDEIGCVEIDVPRDISDPTFPDDNYGYDPFFIKAGHHCMDATTALKYARTRHVDSDFGRMERQQQVMVAIKDKVMNAGALPQLIARMPAILSALSDSFQTDMPVSQQIAMANVARKLDMQNLRRLVFDRAMAIGTMTPSGASVLMPQMEVIKPAVDDFFNPAPAAATATPAPVDPVREQLASEQARVAVLNGTNNPEMGRQVAEWLAGKGYVVTGFANADRNDYAQTQIIDYGGAKPLTFSQLVEQFAIGDENIRPGSGVQADIDLQLIVGADFALPAP